MNKFAGAPDMNKFAAQKAEFTTLNILIKAYNALPPIVDDDYPEYRHYYECAVLQFLHACADNGRIAKLFP